MAYFSLKMLGNALKSTNWENLATQTGELMAIACETTRMPSASRSVAINLRVKQARTKFK